MQGDKFLYDAYREDVRKAQKALNTLADIMREKF